MDGKALAPAGRILLARPQAQPKPAATAPLKPVKLTDPSRMAAEPQRIPRIVPSSRRSISRGRIFGSTTVFAIAPIVIILTPAWLHETAERPNVYRFEQPASVMRPDESSVAIPAIQTESQTKPAGQGFSGIPAAVPERSFNRLPASPTRFVSSLKSKAAPKQSNVTDQVYQIIRRHAPKKVDAKMLARAIVDESRTQKYDPLFVAAVIKSESTFNALAKSHVGARGLMQIMPATGKWIAEKMERDPSEIRGSLTDPGYNLKLGITYLKHLEETYAGDRVFTLVAYNWGPGRVERAFGGRNRVPGEVAQYAIKILNDHRRWQHEFASLDTLRPKV